MRSTFGLNSHTGRRAHPTHLLATSLRQSPQHPILAHGRDSPSLKSAQFSFALVPLAAGRDPSRLVTAPGPHSTRITLLQPPAGHQSDTVPATDHSTNPHHTLSISVTPITPSPHLQLIKPKSTPPAPHPDTGQPPPCITSSHAELRPLANRPQPCLCSSPGAPCTCNSSRPGSTQLQHETHLSLHELQTRPYLSKRKRSRRSCSSCRQGHLRTPGVGARALN